MSSLQEIYTSLRGFGFCKAGCGTGGRVLVIRPSDVYAGVFSAKVSTHNAVLAGSLPVVSVQRCGTSPRRLLTAGSRDRNNHDVLMVHRHSLCVVTLALYFTAGFLNSPKNAFSSAVFRITRYLVKCLRSVTWHFGHYNRLFLLTYLLTYLLHNNRCSNNTDDWHERIT